jgi:membrane protein
VDITNQAMLFAATLLLCFFPFAIVATALAGKPMAKVLASRLGLNEQASAAVGRLFNSTAATSEAVTGSASAVFFVFGGLAAATALQVLYERTFGLERGGATDVIRRLAWLAVLLGVSFLAGWAARWLHRHGGDLLLVFLGLIVYTGFSWSTMWFLLHGRISWLALFPAALATGIFWLGMHAAFALFFSRMVISEDREYGPIGTVFALMAYLIAVGVVVILGAVVGIIWREEGWSVRRTFRRTRAR